MNNCVVFILFGVVMTVVSMLCANSESTFRATVAVMLLVANMGILVLVMGCFEGVYEDDEGDKK